MSEARVDSRLLSLLACPWRLHGLDHVADRLECRNCGAAYGVEDGIPKMRAEEAGLFCPCCRAPLEKRGHGAASAKCARECRMDVRPRGPILGPAAAVSRAIS